MRIRLLRRPTMHGSRLAVVGMSTDVYTRARYQTPIVPARTPFVARVMIRTGMGTVEPPGSVVILCINGIVREVCDKSKCFSMSGVIFRWTERRRPHFVPVRSSHLFSQDETRRFDSVDEHSNSSRRITGRRPIVPFVKERLMRHRQNISLAREENPLVVSAECSPAANRDTLHTHPPILDLTSYVRILLRVLFRNRTLLRHNPPYVRKCHLPRCPWIGSDLLPANNPFTHRGPCRRLPPGPR